MRKHPGVEGGVTVGEALDEGEEEATVPIGEWRHHCCRGLQTTKTKKL
jgi:hypothetical protein